MSNSRIPRSSHKQSMITWIWMTILIGLIYQVRDIAAVHCFECEAFELTGSCLKDDSGATQRDCTSVGQGGCLTYLVTYKSKNQFHSAGRTCTTQKYLDCFLAASGLDMKEGRCLKTTLGWNTVTKLDECRNSGTKAARQGELNRIEMDVRVCTCKGDLCNKIENWKPDEIKEALKVNPDKELKRSATQRLQIRIISWSCLTIGIVIFTLCPFAMFLTH